MDDRPDSHELLLIASREDRLALSLYDAYLRSGSGADLQAAGEHACRAVSALIAAGGAAGGDAHEVITTYLPGVTALLRGVAERVGSNSTSRFRATWDLMGLSSPSPEWLEDETELTCR